MTPLQGLKVLELAGLAPGPFAGLLLADSGASVLRIDRPPSLSGDPRQPTEDGLTRRKSSIAVDLKSASGVALIKRLALHADVVIDPFRPGVLEKLGLGPDVLLHPQLNPRLIYARLTGFRRDGRYRDMAGHDINYLAVSGTLSLLGRDGQKPHPPWNLLADFAGGGATLFQGILLALLARSASGRGQVVEANMVDGSSYLSTFPRMALKTPLGCHGRGRNLLDGGCPWYDVYETKDEGSYMSVGALEPQFFQALLRGLGLEGEGWEEKRWDLELWPALRALFEKTFRSKTRAQWEDVFDGTDACCVPVLGYDELEREQGRDQGQGRGHGREGDQRPPVTLRDTPMLGISPGEGGGGYEGTALRPGEGGEKTLARWLGWQRGMEYDVEGGGLVWKGKESKL